MARFGMCHTLCSTQWPPTSEPVAVVFGIILAMTGGDEMKREETLTPKEREIYEFLEKHNWHTQRR